MGGGVPEPRGENEVASYGGNGDDGGRGDAGDSSRPSERVNSSEAQSTRGQ
jgi:hypothetical protein